MNNITQTNTSKNTYINSAIVAGSAGLGLIGGTVKNHYDKLDVEKGLRDEFFTYKKAAAENTKKITDPALLKAKNQELKDNFNALCDYCRNIGLKKTGKRNLLIGAIVGFAVGILGVFIKKNREKSANNSNSTTIQ